MARARDSGSGACALVGWDLGESLATVLLRSWLWAVHWCLRPGSGLFGRQIESGASVGSASLLVAISLPSKLLDLRCPSTWSYCGQSRWISAES